MYPPVGVGQIRVAQKHDFLLGGKLLIPAGTIMWVRDTASHSYQQLKDKTLRVTSIEARLQGAVPQARLHRLSRRNPAGSSCSEWCGEPSQSTSQYL